MADASAVLHWLWATTQRRTGVTRGCTGSSSWLTGEDGRRHGPVRQRLPVGCGNRFCRGGSGSRRSRGLLVERLIALGLRWARSTPPPTATCTSTAAATPAGELPIFIQRAEFDRPRSGPCDRLGSRLRYQPLQGRRGRGPDRARRDGRTRPARGHQSPDRRDKRRQRSAPGPGGARRVRLRATGVSRQLEGEGDTRHPPLPSGGRASPGRGRWRSASPTT